MYMSVALLGVVSISSMTNIILPTKSICLIERSEKNQIKSIDNISALPFIINQTYKGRTKANILKTLNLLSKLSYNIKFYKLGCNMTLDAVKVSYGGMK